MKSLPIFSPIGMPVILNPSSLKLRQIFFKQTDSETGKHIVDLVVDKAGQKGTGRWTMMEAVEHAVPHFRQSELP